MTYLVHTPEDEYGKLVIDKPITNNKIQVVILDNFFRSQPMKIDNKAVLKYFDIQSLNVIATL